MVRLTPASGPPTDAEFDWPRCLICAMLLTLFPTWPAARDAKRTGCKAMNAAVTTAKNSRRADEGRPAHSNVNTDLFLSRVISVSNNFIRTHSRSQWSERPLSYRIPQRWLEQDSCGDDPVGCRKLRSSLRVCATDFLTLLEEADLGEIGFNRTQRSPERSVYNTLPRPAKRQFQAPFSMQLLDRETIQPQGPEYRARRRCAVLSLNA